MLALRVTLQSY